MLSRTEFFLGEYLTLVEISSSERRVKDTAPQHGSSACGRGEERQRSKESLHDTERPKSLRETG